jgi:hypothetical protein
MTIKTIFVNNDRYELIPFEQSCFTACGVIMAIVGSKFFFSEKDNLR